MQNVSHSAFIFGGSEGIEPLSENLLTGPSPWAVYLLDLLTLCADKQAHLVSSPLMHDRFKGENPMHVHR